MQEQRETGTECKENQRQVQDLSLSAEKNQKVSLKCLGFITLLLFLKEYF